jgi:hypothetical protein
VARYSTQPILCYIGYVTSSSTSGADDDRQSGINYYWKSNQRNSDTFIYNKTNRCTNFPNLFLLKNELQHVSGCSSAFCLNEVCYSRFFVVLTNCMGCWGSVVAKALRYKSEGPGIDSPCRRVFFPWNVTVPCSLGSTQPRKMSTRLILGVKAAGA